MPRGLAARFALLLVGALLLANLVALTLLSTERSRLMRDARDGREIERLAVLVPVLEGADPARRARLAAETSTRLAEVRLGPVAQVGRSGGDRWSRALAARLAEVLPGREVRAAVGPAAAALAPGGAPHGPRPAVLISVALAGPDGPFWLNLSVRGPPVREDVDGRAIVVVLVLSLGATLAVGLVFIRRLTRPLAALATAAQAAGRGDRGARVPVEGAAEMRAAARAFNEMQAEIARFDTERMRVLGAVGHDLRTPITSLRLRAEMVDDEAQRAAMVRTLDEMAVMAEGLVAYARGSREAEPVARMDLRAFLAGIAADRGLPFAAEGDAAVQARPVALARAVGNLLDNALRYGGGARLSLARAGSEAVIAVEDDGPGIPPERLEAVFDPFVRGETSRNAETGGAGLGLSIARAVALAHGGSVSLANRAEGGLRAELRLPLA